MGRAEPAEVRPSRSLPAPRRPPQRPQSPGPRPAGLSASLPPTWPAAREAYADVRPHEPACSAWTHRGQPAVPLGVSLRSWQPQQAEADEQQDDGAAHREPGERGGAVASGDADRVETGRVVGKSRHKAAEHDLIRPVAKEVNSPT